LFYSFFLFNYKELKKKNIVIILILFFCITSIPKVKHFYYYLFNGITYNNIYENKILINLRKNDKNIFRVVTISRNQIHSKISQNIMASYGLESAGGYSSVHPKEFDTFWNKLVDKSSGGSRLYLYPRSDQKFYNYDFDSHHNIEILSLLNVKYIISDFPIISKNLEAIHHPKQTNMIYKKAYEIKSVSELIKKIKYEHDDKNIFIYKNIKYLNRFFFINNSIFNNQKINEKLFIAEKESQNIINLKIIKYTPDKINLEINSKEKGYLVVTNNFNNNWQVKINNKKGEINKVFKNFWAIEINKGFNKIDFFYDHLYKKFIN